MNIYSENYKLRRIKALIDQAQAKGGALEARKVLFEAMSSIIRVVDGQDVNQTQIESLKFVHASLNEFLLNDVPLEIAFCVDKSAGGQRSNTHGEDVFYILKIDDEIAKQIRLTGKPNVIGSLKNVANRLDSLNEKVSAARLKLSWERLGSLEGFKVRNEDP